MAEQLLHLRLVRLYALLLSLSGLEVGFGREDGGEEAVAVSRIAHGAKYLGNEVQGYLTDKKTHSSGTLP